MIPKDSKYKYRVRYGYDESGNRFRKMIEQTEITNPGLLPIEWTLIKDEVYVRDVSGKEIAVYQNSNLSYYNIWGNGLEGKIKGNLKYYYYKDHLGSVRAVLEGSSGKILQAQDYDAWGDIFRQYSSEDTTVNKFTSKERDTETGYDYFGARYYDSRIGRWGQVDALMNKYIFISPYSYTLNNPLILTDPTGLWIPEYDSKTNIIRVRAEKDDNLEGLYSQLGISREDFANKYRDVLNNNIDEYQVKEGESNFDITNFVLKNKNFEDDPTNLNCFSSVLYGSGIFDEEIHIHGGYHFSEILEKDYSLKKTMVMNSGDIASWVDPDNITWHAAIYIISDAAGTKYYIGRPGENQLVKLQDSKDILKLYKNFQEFYFKPY